MSLVSHVEAATRSYPQVPWSSSPQRYQKTKGTKVWSWWNVSWATHLKLGKESLTIHAKKQTLAERTLNEECSTASASSFQDQLQELRLQCLGIAMWITLFFLSRLYTPHSVITICWPFQWHGRPWKSFLFTITPFIPFTPFTPFTLALSPRLSLRPTSFWRASFWCMAECRQQTSSATRAISILLELCECCLRSVEKCKTVLKYWGPKQLSGAPVTTSGGIRPDLAWLITSEAAPKAEINSKNKYRKEKVSDALVSERQRW